MNLFEVDVNALQALLSALVNAEQELSNLTNPLSSHYNAFDSTFSSPYKGSFEQNIIELGQFNAVATELIQVVRLSLNTLLTTVEQAEQLTF